MQEKKEHLKMRKKSEEEIKLFLYKKIVIETCILIIPLILYQCNMLSLLYSFFLSVIFISDILTYPGENFVQPATTTRKRKPSKPGKSISGWFARMKHSLNPNGSTCTEIRGYTIDRLFVYAKDIAKESNGSVVFKGVYEGREVVVKRLLKAPNNNVALKQVQHLVMSDQHPNIVRLHGVKHDKEYVYLALERCICSLSDLVSDEFGHQAIGAPWINATKQDVYLWRNNGYPSALLLKLMRDMVHGLVHLHKLGIIHEDINPQNVMIAKGMDICAKLSEIGISNYLLSHKSSLTQNAPDMADSCSSRWSPPKQKHHKHQRWAADMFSLGCVFYFCLSRGGHPSDHQLQDDISNGMSLHLVAHIPEALHLLSRLLDPNPKMRPKAEQVLHHPLFWNSETRLSFLRDVSDWLEQESRKRRRSEILIALESVAGRVFGARWDKKMESEFVKDCNRRRHYKGRSVQHLLRVVRNKMNHYHQSPKEIQELLGPVPEGFDDYFRCRFPRLLMEVYKVIIRHGRSEIYFEKYFGVDSVPIV